jgi:hypothetical protein
VSQVSSHDRHPVRQSDGGDAQVGLGERGALAFQFAAQPAVDDRGIEVE